MCKVEIPVSSGESVVVCFTDISIDLLKQLEQIPQGDFVKRPRVICCICGLEEKDCKSAKRQKECLLQAGKKFYGII